MKLNGREYPTLPDSFLYDLKIELMASEPTPTSVGSMPTRGIKKVAISGRVNATLIGMTAVTQETRDAKAKETACTWAVPRPDGRAEILTATVPYTGSEAPEEAFAATLSQAEALFHRLWGSTP